MTNSVGDRGLEHYALGLNASKVHTHGLAGLEHDSCTRILQLRDVQMQAVSDGWLLQRQLTAESVPCISICAKSTRASWV